ncbi:hypothetical protein AAVH_19492 [Aphelenchoides avenae]|nr:hypothetical protein AAVH_19492 [Aphelenchus avenae]
MFLFRLAQSIDSPKVKLLSDPKYGCGIAVSVTAAVSIVLILLFGFLWMSDEKIKSTIRNDDPALYAIIKDQPLSGFEIELNALFVLLLAVFGIFMGLCGAGMVVSAVRCQYFIRSSHRPWLSERSLQLYRKLANILVLDLALFAVTTIVPISCAAVTFLVSPENTGTATILALCCVEWYPIATNVLIVSYIKPYRRGLRRMSRFVIPLGKAEPSNTVFLSRAK